MSDKFMQYPKHRKGSSIDKVLSMFKAGQRVIAAVDITEGEFDMPYAKANDVLRILHIHTDGRVNPIEVHHELGYVEHNKAMEVPSDFIGDLASRAFFVNEREITSTVTNPYMDRLPPKGARYVNPEYRK
tara:strand:- start:299 stop:688 length:390 start_codon:yes stop_codon:yes gene_type:complete